MLGGYTRPATRWHASSMRGESDVGCQRSGCAELSVSRLCRYSMISPMAAQPTPKAHLLSPQHLLRHVTAHWRTSGQQARPLLRLPQDIRRRLTPPRTRASDGQEDGGSCLATRRRAHRPPNRVVQSPCRHFSPDASEDNACRTSVLRTAQEVCSRSAPPRSAHCRSGSENVRASSPCSTMSTPMRRMAATVLAMVEAA